MSSVKEFQAVLEYIKCHDVALFQSAPTNQDLKLKKVVFKIMVAKKEKEKLSTKIRDEMSTTLRCL